MPRLVRVLLFSWALVHLCGIAMSGHTCGFLESSWNRGILSQIFDDMLQRSIPQYNARRMVSQIDRKRMSFEGVLTPVTARWNEELVHLGRLLLAVPELRRLGGGETMNI